MTEAQTKRQVNQSTSGFGTAQVVAASILGVAGDVRIYPA
jgi:hypothetical protein